eukprot:CAMPEP_0202865790 /NCGR_PEP_ID=MMETSP1391-20130828/6351_1 /ASSEMBLY_ACC=CAM_ASM_000867 /TAXON_ID=1034604 /ORGANISM="Chlamydomonas leiostraca, Strain SAG 11-49" /LENGTH=365 /DNA_ID=CAMNT_0049545667 /DNA_START=103 /DNA_END=1200 /DNA_ORIENTATION=+
MAAMSTRGRQMARPIAQAVVTTEPVTTRLRSKTVKHKYPKPHPATTGAPRTPTPKPSTSPAPPPSTAAAAPKPAAAPAAPTTVKVVMRITNRVQMGQSVGIVGSCPEMGAWDGFKAVRLTWGEGDVWSGEVQLPIAVGTVEYKYVVLGPNNAIYWQAGANRSLDVKEVSLLAGAAPAVAVCEHWGPGEREVKPIVPGGLLDDTAAAARPTPIVAKAGGRPAISAQAAKAATLRTDTAKLHGRMQYTHQQLAKFEELRTDVARLVAAGPLPQWVTAKALKDLAKLMTEFEDLREELGGVQVTADMSDDQVAKLTKRLDRYEQVQEQLVMTVGQLAARGGCPVAFQVGKAMAAAAASAHVVPRPWRR